MKKILVSSLMLLVFLISSWSSCYASQTDYAIRGILPENQQANGRTYFDLLMMVDQRQTLEIEIHNYGQQSASYSVEANSAFTNDNLTIEYTKNQRRANSLKYSFQDLVKLPKRVEVPPQSKKIVGIQLKMPAKKYQGIILGGLRVKKLGQSNTLKKNQIGVDTAYTIGVVLREANTPVLPDLKLKKITPKLVKQLPAVAVKLENTQPTIISQVTFQGSLKQAEQEILTLEKKNATIAPNTDFNFIFSSDKKLKAGKYQLNLKIYDQQEHHWQIKKIFLITPETAQKINQGLGGNKLGSWLPIICFSLAGAVLLLLFLLIKKQQSQKPKIR